MENKKILVCVLDKKSGVQKGYMVLDNETTAVRTFQIACERDEVFQKWPEDFELKIIATIDGEKVTNDVRTLAKAAYFVQKTKKDAKN